MKKVFPNFSYLFAVICCMAFAQIGMSQTTVDVTYTVGGFNAENGWKLVDVTAGTEVACFNNPPAGTTTYTLTDGNEYELQGYETFGDGWCAPANISMDLNLLDGTQINLYDGNTGASGTGAATCGAVPAAGEGSVAFAAVIALPSCELICPEDIVVSTDSDFCGANVTLPDAAFMGDCGMVPCGPLTEVPSGLQDLVMAPNLALTQFSVTGAPTTSPAAVTMIGNWNSDNSFNTESPEITVEGISIGFLPFGGADCAANEFEFTISMADYNTVAADGSLDFEIAADADVNGFCASNTIEFSLFIADEVCPFGSDFDDGDDDETTNNFPLGTTTVTYSTVDVVTGLPIECTFDVTVEDLTGPNFNNCPDDFTVTLDPGDCVFTLNFDTTAVDNCPATATVFPIGTDATTPINCNTGNVSTGNQHWNPTTAPGNGEITSLEMPVALGTAGVSYSANVYKLTGAFPGGTLTLISSGVVTASLGGGATDIIPMVSTETVTAGEDIVVEFIIPQGIICFPGYGANPPTYLQAAACGVPTPTLASSLGVPPGMAYSIGITGIGSTVEQVSEFGNGEALPIGINIIEYQATDGSGNVSTCTFTVVVEEFPEELQTSTLACNGGINFSVNADCQAVITADMILEGGPYGCYEDFVLEIDGIPAGAVSGNGTNAVTINADLIAAFVANGMYGPFEIAVFDPAAANNSCWNGDFMLEDKLAPVFVACEDVTIQCTDSTIPGSLAGPGVRSFSDEPAAAIVSNSAAVLDLEVDNGTINSMTVDMDISHTWIGDLTITLTSPAGTAVVLFDGQCGNVDDLVATFSDEANGPFDCAQNAAGNTVTPVEALAVFNGESSAGTWNMTVADGVGGDNGTLNSYSLNINGSGGFDLGLSAELTDNCGNAVVDFSDEEELGACTDEFGATITRTYTAIDAKGNFAVPCVQTIFIERETLATVTLPVNYDGLPGNNPIVECDAVVLDAVEPFRANGDPNPSAAVYGSVGGVGTCGTIIDYYTDVVIPICDQTCDYTNNSYKVIRKFTILDWCTGEIIEPTQIIKVQDTTAPVLAALPDLTVSTDIWGCGATIELPAAAATDNCTSSESITYSFSADSDFDGNGFDDITITTVGNTLVLSDPAKTMPGQPVVVTVRATDCCGNFSEDSFNVSVVDLIPPVVVAETSRTVSLSTDGLAKAFAEDFDDGSHDGCGPIGFFVKRMDNGSPCPSLDKFPPAGNDNAQFNESVHFCCSDVQFDAAGNAIPVMVQFQVCDDADMNGITGTFGDNCNTVMVEVIVQDKLAPVILCPGPQTISCIDLAGTDLTDFDLLDELFGTAVAAGTCNVTITQSATGTENCGAGVIFRNFTATNSAGTTSCQQIITVTAGPDNTLTCDRISFAALNNNIYDWCDVNDNNNDPDDDLPAVEIDCTEGLTVPEVVIDINGLCTEAGISIEVDSFNFAGGACRKYLVHYEVIDQCIFDENYVDPATGEIDPFNSGNGYFEFFLEVDAFDDEEPTPMCEDITVAAGSCTGVDAAITVTATDNCTDPAFFGYQWRLDAFNDNTIDFPASGWVATSSVTPQQVGFTEFPIGVHRIFWIISDGCGNDATCSQLVTVTGNEKAPTPYCIDGLATAVMPSTGTVALWANDFDAGSFDNCDTDLLLSMVPEQDVDGLGDDAAYNQSFQHPNVTQQPNGDWGFEFDCSYIENGISGIIEVRVYVTDADGNYDYCTASLRIDDNFDACPNADGTLKYDVTGDIKTELGEPVENTDVTVDADYSEFPMTVNVAGSYSFNLVEFIDYTITPERNDDHLNGITTLDIVQIQKHILGIETLNSPYQLIAADVNNDCVVTGADLVQLRKLILGKYANEQFPNNTSWRFIEADYVFTNPQAPCGFSEETDIFNLSAEQVSNFTATKIGDVNLTASANLAMGSETRSNENVEFVVVDNAMTSGNTYSIDFLAKDFADVYGFQNTINLTGVEFVSVEAGALNVTENNFGLASNNEVLVSVDLANGVTVADDAVLFTLVVKANTSANVSESVAINSNRVEAQTYVGRDLEVLGNTVVFRDDSGEFASADFALFQNEPNPFNGQTTIGFELPQTAQATLTVFDVTGKVLYTKVDGYAKGYNTVTISRDNVPAVGVLYYKLESGNNVATMKMIILE